MTIDLGPAPRLPDPVRRVWRRVGWRGLYLILFGATFVLLGIDDFEDRPDYALVEVVAPLWAWARAFQVAGAVAFVAGVFVKPPKLVGFAALQAVSSFWGIGAVYSAAVLDVPGAQVSTGMVWLLVSVAILCVAHLIEPVEAATAVPEAPEGWRDVVPR